MAAVYVVTPKRERDEQPRVRPQDRQDNFATWSVILGSLLCVVLYLGASYSRQPVSGLVITAVIFVYLIVLTVMGHVNILRILWGETIDEDKPDVNPRVVTQATIAVAIIAIGALLFDLVSDDEWGWFSLVGALMGIGYLVLILRNRRQKGGTE